MKFELIISIVSYDTLESSIKLSKLLIKKLLNKINFKILILENDKNSKNNFEDFLLENKNYVELNFSDSNIGYAAGHNLNIYNSYQLSGNSSYFLILNCDIDLNNFKLFSFIKKIKNKNIKACSPSQIINNSISFPRRSLLGKKLFNDKKNNMQYSDRLDGAFMIISKEIINEVGILPEYYFLYFEELHFSYKIISNKYKIIYLKDFAYHHYGTCKNSKVRSFYNAKNQFIFSKYCLKNYALLYLLKSFPRNLLSFLILNKYRINYLEGIKEGVKIFFN